MIERIKEGILNNPKLTLVVVLLATFAFAPGIANIIISDDLRDAIPKESPIQKALVHLEDSFGASQIIIAAITVPNGETIYTVDNLDMIRELTDELALSEHVNRVQSMANVDFSDRDETGAMIIHPLVEERPEGVSAVAQIQKNAEKDALLTQAFISKDKRSFAIFVDPAKSSSDIQAEEAVAAIVAQHAPGAEVHWGGLPFIRSQTSKLILADMTTLNPLVFVVLTFVLFWALRSLHGVLITLTVIGLSILPPMGLMGYLGLLMTAGNNMFPVLILGTACADSIHVLSLFYLGLRQGLTPRESARRIMDDLWLPVFLTSITTAVGFLTLLLSEIPPIRSLGGLVAFGVFFAWLLSTFLLPALLTLVPVPKKVEESEHGFLKLMLPIFEKIALNHAGKTALISVGILALFGSLMLPKLTVEPRAEKTFPVGHAAREGSEFIDKNFGGTTPVELLIHADPRDPELLAAVYELEKALDKVPEVGSTQSVAQMVARVHETLRGDDPQYRSIPSLEAMNAQAVLLASIQGNPDNFEQFARTDYSAFRLTIRLQSMSIEKTEAVIGTIRELVAKYIPDDVELEWTGKALFESELAGLMLTSASMSVLASMILVFIICWIFIGSFWQGLLGIVPICFALIANFSIMGALDIGLSVATAIVTPIVIGVGVDYAIHFLTRWRQEQKAVADGTDAEVRFNTVLVNTMEECGPPILFNALAVALGLGVLFFSGFLPVQSLGLLAVVSMASTSLAALVLLPVIKRLFKIFD